MMRTVLRLAALLTLVVPLAARAQNAVGRIDGSVFDENGFPLARVTVSARSPTQIGGARVTQTNESGEFHLLGLIPGDFAIRFEAQGLRPVSRDQIKVHVNVPVNLDVLMEPLQKE